MKWVTNLQAAWTRNDGKPVEQWTPGADLPDVLFRSLAVLAGLAQIALMIYGLLRL